MGAARQRRNEVLKKGQQPGWNTYVRIEYILKTPVITQKVAKYEGKKKKTLIVLGNT